MKKLLVLFVMSCITLSLAAQDFDVVVGKLENNLPVITIDKDAACRALSKNLLSASNIKETYTKVEIVKVSDYYALVFRGSTYRTTFAVKAVGTSLVAKVKVSCTTTGKNCTLDGNACTPSSSVGQCACTACPEGETCTKTCSSETLIE